MTTYTKEETDFLVEVHAAYASLAAKEDDNQRFAEAMGRVLNKEPLKHGVTCRVVDRKFYFGSYIVDEIKNRVGIDCTVNSSMDVTIDRDYVAVSFYKYAMHAKNVTRFMEYVKKIDFAIKYGYLNIETIDAAKYCIRRFIPDREILAFHSIPGYHIAVFHGDFSIIITTYAHNALEARDFACTVLEYYSYFYAEAQDVKVAQD